MAVKERKNNTLASDNWVNKSNALNEVRNNRMSISQMRLFTIYLSKINPLNIESREVIFKLDEYTKIMQFKQTNTTRLIKTAEDLLGITIKYWDKTGEYSSDGLTGFVMSQLFKRFRLFKGENNEWYVSIDCHDDAVKLMFDLQKYYFKYELWNALQLTSFNQQRMYELLKQYEKIGERVVTVKDLREWLGLKNDDYPRWDNFKKRVLDASQEALARYTDIQFKWEIAGKRGQGGKINSIKFIIEKNNDYVRQITLDDYLLEQDNPEYEHKEPEEFERPEDEEIHTSDKETDTYLDFYSEACDNEYSNDEIQVLHDLLKDIVPGELLSTERYDYLRSKYHEMQSRKPKQSRFGYLKKIIKADLENK